MRYGIALLAIAGIAAGANAQNTRLIFEAQNVTQGGGWSSAVSANIGDVVQVRLRAQLINNTATVLGLAGVTLQPTLSNFIASDSTDFNDGQNGFTDDGNGTHTGTYDSTGNPSRGVQAADGLNGRMDPFWTGGPMTTAAPSGLLSSFRDAGNSLRFAGSTAGNPLTNLAFGVGLAQLNRNSNPATGTATGSEGFYGAGGYNYPGQTGSGATAAGPTHFGDNAPTLFKYSVTIGSGHAAGDVLDATAPLAYIFNGRAVWYTTATGTNGLNAPIVAGDVSDGTITIVPAPGAIALLGLGGLIVGRRRR